MLPAGGGVGRKFVFEVFEIPSELESLIAVLTGNFGNAALRFKVLHRSGGGCISARQMSLGGSDVKNWMRKQDIQQFDFMLSVFARTAQRVFSKSTNLLSS